MAHLCLTKSKGDINLIFQNFQKKRLKLSTMQKFKFSAAAMVENIKVSTFKGIWKHKEPFIKLLIPIYPSKIGVVECKY